MQTLQRSAPTLVRPHGRSFFSAGAVYQRLREMIVTAAAMLVLWARRVRERDELSGMSALERRDLSLSPCDVEREANKWFWQP